MKGALLISSEHASNALPAKYAAYFRSQSARLETHEGYDIGAQRIAENLAKMLQAPLFTYPYTRLLIDPNRSEHHKKLFSDVSQNFSDKDKADLIETYYRPHRQRIFDYIAESGVPILHFAIHSFTPIWKEKPRTADIGILYDPARAREKKRAERSKLFLAAAGWKVRLNYPYRGSSDGLTTTLRQSFDATRYLGFEIEINQRLLPKKSDVLSKVLCEVMTAVRGYADDI